MAVSVEPANGALDNPLFGQHGSFSDIGATDDLDPHAAVDLRQAIVGLRPLIALFARGTGAGEYSLCLPQRCRDRVADPVSVGVRQVRVDRQCHDAGGQVLRHGQDRAVVGGSVGGLVV